MITQVNENIQQIDNQSYRMVTKEYYCYVCQKQDKKMLPVNELKENGLQCDTCHQDFTEIVQVSPRQ